jgi:hypothetical protein
VASLTDDSRGVIYNPNIFVTQATSLNFINIWTNLSYLDKTWAEFSMEHHTLETIKSSPIITPSYTISNGKSCLGQVFNFKLGSFASKQHKRVVNMQPLLKLKNLPRFSPAN